MYINTYTHTQKKTTKVRKSSCMVSFLKFFYVFDYYLITYISPFFPKLPDTYLEKQEELKILPISTINYYSQKKSN